MSAAGQLGVAAGLQSTKQFPLDPTHRSPMQAAHAQQRSKQNMTSSPSRRPGDVSVEKMMPPNFAPLLPQYNHVLLPPTHLPPPSDVTYSPSMFAYPPPPAIVSASSDLDFVQQRHMQNLSLKGDNMQAKMNTWPLRPPNQNAPQQTRFGDAQESPLLPPSGAFAVQTPSALDLEFNQYVSAVHRNRQARSAAGNSGAHFNSFAANSNGAERSENPWSAGDGALAWPPFLQTDDKKWFAPDVIFSQLMFEIALTVSGSRILKVTSGSYDMPRMRTTIGVCRVRMKIAHRRPSTVCWYKTVF